MNTIVTAPRIGIPIALEELKEAAGIDRATPLRTTTPEENESV